MITPAFLSVADTATRLGCGKSTVLRHIAEQRLCAIKSGRKTLIPVEDIERLITAMRDGTVAVGVRPLWPGEERRRALHKAKVTKAREDKKAARAAAATT
jgi:excisionase family DNA binding protein